MNELFTLLIILAAIISFLNKIFGQKRPQQTGAPSPLPGQKSKEWVPPWLEPEDLGIPDFEQEEAHTQQIIIEPSPDKVTSAALKPLIPPHEFARPAITIESSPTRINRLELDLSSGDALKQGIVLAEILGTCKGRKNFNVAWRH